jgi:hypothetical protein
MEVVRTRFWSAGIFLHFSKNDLWFYFDNGRGTFQISLPNENVKYFLNETVQNDTVYSATIQIIYLFDVYFRILQ